MTPNVLIIDDSSLARRTTKQYMEELGAKVDMASDGAQGLERFCLQPPDLVLLDMVMTGMYGLDVLAQMRQLNPEVRVIIITADIQESTVEQVRAAGAKGMLNKPLNREKLAAAVKRVLEGGESWN